MENNLTIGAQVHNKGSRPGDCVGCPLENVLVDIKKYSFFISHYYKI